MQGAIDFWRNEPTHVVIHHGPCDDGEAAAAIFYSCCSSSTKPVAFIKMHPKDELLTAANRELISGRNVVLVDISFSASVMVEAATLAHKIVVLDHHLTNQAELLSLDVPNMRIVFEQDVSGCRLAWRFLNGGRETHMPRAFYYIGLKDVWQHKTNEDALYFTTAFQKPATLEDWREYSFCGTKTAQVIEEGRHIYRYQQGVLRTMLEKVCYTEYQGYRMGIVNAPYPWTSDLGEMICASESERTIAVIWSKTVGGPFVVSLRSNDMWGPNTEPIARAHGGGGHAHSSALRLDCLPENVFSE